MRATLRFLKRNPIPFTIVGIHTLIYAVSLAAILNSPQRVCLLEKVAFRAIAMHVDCPGFALAAETHSQNPWVRMITVPFLVGTVQWLVIGFGLQAIVRFFRTKPGQTQTKW